MLGILAQPSYKLGVRCQLEIVVPQMFLHLLLQVKSGLHRDIKAGLHLALEIIS
jgi:hypothetical protein